MIYFLEKMFLSDGATLRTAVLKEQPLELWRKSLIRTKEPKLYNFANTKRNRINSKHVSVHDTN